MREEDFLGREVYNEMRGVIFRRIEFSPSDTSYHLRVCIES